MSHSRKLKAKGQQRRLAFRPQAKSVNTCPRCGKYGYTSKAEAKRVAREAHRGEAMNTYRCGGQYHIGHLSPAIRAGLTTRLERYG